MPRAACSWPAQRGQPSPALRQLEIAELRQGQVAAEIDVDVVVIGLVGAAFEVDAIADVMVGDDAHRGRQADRPRIADLGAGQLP